MGDAAGYEDALTGEKVGGPFIVQPVDTEPKIAGVPFWLASLGSFLMVTALALLVAVRKVAAPGRGRAA